MWLAISASHDRTARAESLSFGVVPQLSASKTADQWTPLLIWLEKKSGLGLELTISKDFDVFEARLKRGDLDIAFANPFQYLDARQAVGYEAFARERDAVFQGQIVVRRDSGYRTLADLDGQTLALSAPHAFAASMLPLAALAEAKVRVEVHYVASHESVYRTIAQGLYAAGGAMPRTLATVDPKVSAELRVIWSSPRYNSHPLIHHPRVAAASLQRLKAALLAMDKDLEGQAILARLAIKGWQAAADADYDDARRLRFDPAAPNPARP